MPTFFSILLAFVGIGAILLAVRFAFVTLFGDL